MRPRLPHSGLPYELFNSSVLLAGLAVFWYVGSEPSAVTDSALSETLSLILSPRAWGWGLLGAGLVGVICSYCSDTWQRRGYATVIGVCAAWSASLLVGAAIAALFTDVDWDLTSKAFGSALLFGWIARGLFALVLRSSKAPT